MAGSRRPAVQASASALEPHASRAPSVADTSDEEEETAVADPNAVEDWGESTVVEDDPEAAAKALAEAAAQSSAPAKGDDGRHRPAGKSGRAGAASTSDRPRPKTQPPPPPPRAARAGSLPPAPRAPSHGGEFPHTSRRGTSGPAPGPAPRGPSSIAAVAAQPTGPIGRDVRRSPTMGPGLPASTRGEARLRSSPPVARAPSSPFSRPHNDEEESTLRPKRHRPSSFGDEASSTLDELTTEDMNDEVGLFSELDRGAGFLTSGDSAQASLVIVAGNDRGRELKLAGRAVVVGRGTTCDLVLTDIAASRKHAKLSFDGRRYQVRDLGSGNGTLVNDQFQDGPYALRDGDRIELGNTVMRIDHPASRAPAADRVGSRKGAPLIEPDAIEDEGADGFDDDESTLGGPDGPTTTPEPAAARALAAVRAQRAQDGEASYTLPPIPPGGDVVADPAPAAPAAAAPAAPAARQPVELPPPSPPAPEYPRAPTGSAPVHLPNPSPSSELSDYQQVLLAPKRKRRRILATSAIGAALAVSVLAAMSLAGDEPDQASDGPALAATSQEPRESNDEAAGADTDEPAEREAEPLADEEADVEVPVADFEGETIGAPDDEASPPAEPGPVERTLPASAWGTDEEVLVARAAAIREAREQAESAADDDEGDERPRAQPQRQPRRQRAARTQASRSAAQQASIADAAMSEAADQYRNREFAAAASTLRAAAARASGNDAEQLRRRATGYERMGNYFEQGNSTRRSSPSAAYVAYQEAHRIDQQLGGAHAALLEAQIRVLAPQAAGSYMANGRYEAAKDAADAAARFGAGAHPLVERVRNGLDRKAEELFRQAHKLRGSDPDQAVKLLRRVQRMVPEGNPWRERARQMLAARGEH